MLGPHVVTVVREVAGGTDPYGDETPGSVTEFDISGCSVQPGSGGLFADPVREATATAYSVWAPLEPRVLDTDRIRWDELLFEVDGSVGCWAFTPGHQVIPLKVVSG